MSVLSLALGGCVEKAAVWSPEGADSSIAGAWTIRGATPGMLTCAAARVTWVDLVFVRAMPDLDASTDVVIGTFTFPCAQGAFDSRPAPALAAGTYTVHWRFTGQGDAGAISFDTASVTIVAAPHGHVDVPPGDFAP